MHPRIAELLSYITERRARLAAAARAEGVAGAGAVHAAAGAAVKGGVGGGRRRQEQPRCQNRSNIRVSWSGGQLM